MSDHSELKRLAETATPQDFDSAETKSENGYIECPCCSGEGEVDLESEYCNYDNVAIGVQFYGIGNEFGAAEAFYRAANPAAVLALIAEVEALRKDAERYRWLRNPSDGVVVRDRQSHLRGEYMDIRIDAAMSEGVPPCTSTT